MVEFSLFSSKTFLGANAVGFIVSFAMLAMFFFTALYMQNMLGYSAVEAGVRFLPPTLVVELVGPLGGRPAGPQRTRLKSSHPNISCAAFCLQKKHVRAG